LLSSTFNQSEKISEGKGIKLIGRIIKNDNYLLDKQKKSSLWLPEYNFKAMKQ